MLYLKYQKAENSETLIVAVRIKNNITSVTSNNINKLKTTFWNHSYLAANLSVNTMVRSTLIIRRLINNRNKNSIIAYNMYDNYKR